MYTYMIVRVSVPANAVDSRSTSYLVDPGDLHDMFKEAFGAKRCHVEPEQKEEARTCTYIRTWLEGLANKADTNVLEEQSFERWVGDNDTARSLVNEHFC